MLKKSLLFLLFEVHQSFHIKMITFLSKLCKDFYWNDSIVILISLNAIISWVSVVMWRELSNPSKWEQNSVSRTESQTILSLTNRMFFFLSVSGFLGILCEMYLGGPENTSLIPDVWELANLVPKKFMTLISWRLRSSEVTGWMKFWWYKFHWL